MLLSVAGDLDLASAPLIEQHVRDAEEQRPGEIVIDLQQLGFIDNAGIRSLMWAHARAAAGGYALLLRRVPRQARRLFALAGVEAELNLED